MQKIFEYKKEIEKCKERQGLTKLIHPAARSVSTASVFSAQL